MSEERYRKGKHTRNRTPLGTDHCPVGVACSFGSDTDIDGMMDEYNRTRRSSMASEPMGTYFNKATSKVSEDKDIEGAAPVLEQPDDERRCGRPLEENGHVSTARNGSSDSSSTNNGGRSGRPRRLTKQLRRKFDLNAKKLEFTMNLNSTRQVHSKSLRAKTESRKPVISLANMARKQSQHFTHYLLRSHHKLKLSSKATIPWSRRGSNTMSR
jgi:hypothetical protein